MGRTLAPDEPPVNLRGLAQGGGDTPTTNQVQPSNVHTAWAQQTDGAFTVMAKKNAKFSIVIAAGGLQQTVDLGPLSGDFTVQTCVVMSEAAAHSTIDAFLGMLAPFEQASQMSFDAGLADNDQALLTGQTQAGARLTYTVGSDT